MKKLSSLLLLLIGVTWAAYADPTPVHRKQPAFTQPLAQQIASYITYPAILQHNGKGGMTVIRFRLTADHRLTQVEVCNGLESFKMDLIRQLTGKKVSVSKLEQQPRYTVRLHFQPR